VLQTGIHVRIHSPSLTSVRVFFRSRSKTALEILALRQQIVVLKRKRPRPRLNQFDRLFLDYPALRLVPVGRSLSSGQTRDSRRLAWGGISTLLEVAVASTCWPTENYCRNSGCMWRISAVTRFCCSSPCETTPSTFRGPPQKKVQPIISRL
jgi:hypothetical protein